MTDTFAFQWDGEAMRPAGPAQAKRCDQVFVIGQRYTLTEHQVRSGASHNHYFACVHDAWQNLPDQHALHFPSPEHLRKYALVRCGYAHAMVVPCRSAKDARAFAIECRKKDLFTVVDIDGETVTMWTAHSQSMRAMGKQTFSESKNKVLDWLGATFGYAPQDLGQAT